MTYVNPISNEEFENEKLYVESLLKSYVWCQKQLATFKEIDKNLTVHLGALDPKSDEKTGSFRLDGLTLTAKIKKRVNVTYPKNGASDSPLVSLMKDESFREILEPLLRLSYDESGQKVEKFLTCPEALTDGSVHSALREKILASRLVSPGKPEIAIQRLGDEIPT